MTVVLRPCERPGDVDVLCRQWAASLPADPLPRARADWILERVGTELAWLLEIEDHPVGYVLAAADGEDGWLLGIGVEPRHRRAGHGGALLERALAALAGHGCTGVTVGGPGEAYVVPGIDAAAYPAAPALLARAGFAAVEETFGMAVDLAGAPAPRPAPAGIAIGPLAEDRARLLAMVERALSPGWAVHLASVADGDRVLVARDAAGAPVGFAALDVFPGCPGRFGPMGVVPEVRGRGVGGALLNAALRAMHARGDARAWFLWGPESDSGVAMYRTAGFELTRRFTRERRTLHPDRPPPPAGTP